MSLGLFNEGKFPLSLYSDSHAVDGYCFTPKGWLLTNVISIDIRDIVAVHRKPGTSIVEVRSVPNNIADPIVYEIRCGSTDVSHQLYCDLVNKCGFSNIGS